MLFSLLAVAAAVSREGSVGRVAGSAAVAGPRTLAEASASSVFFAAIANGCSLTVSVANAFVVQSTISFAGPRTSWYAVGKATCSSLMQTR